MNIKQNMLDDKQQQFVDLSIKQKQNCYLIGPPGTGKTTTLLATCHKFHEINCVNNKSLCYAILLLAFNNSVIADIKEKFSKQKDCQPTIKTFHGYFNLPNSMTNIWYKNNNYQDGFRDDVQMWLTTHPNQKVVNDFKNALVDFYEFNPTKEIKNLEYNNIKQLIDAIQTLTKNNLWYFKQLFINNSHVEKFYNIKRNSKTRRQNFWRFRLLIVDEVQDLQPVMVLIIGFLQWITTLQYQKAAYQQLQTICAGDPHQLINQGLDANDQLLNSFTNLNKMKQIQLIRSYRYNQFSANTINTLVKYQEKIIGLNQNTNKSQWYIMCDYYNFNDKEIDLLKEIQDFCPEVEKTKKHQFQVKKYQQFLKKYQNNIMIQSLLFGVNKFLKTLKEEFNDDWSRCNILSFNNDFKESKNTSDLITKLFKTFLLCELYRGGRMPPPYFDEPTREQGALFTTLHKFKGKENDFIFLINLFTYHSHWRLVGYQNLNDMTKTPNLENIALSRHKERLIVFSLDFTSKFMEDNGSKQVFLPDNLRIHCDDLIVNNDFYFYHFENKQIRLIKNPWKTIIFFEDKPNYYPTHPLSITTCQPNFEVRHYIKKLLPSLDKSINATDINDCWILKGVSNINVEFKSTIGKFIPQLATLNDQSLEQLFSNFLEKDHRYDSIMILENNLDPVKNKLNEIRKVLKDNNQFVLDLIKDHYEQASHFEIPIIYGYQSRSLNRLINFYWQDKNSKWIKIDKHIKSCHFCQSQSLSQVLINQKVRFKLKSIIGIADYLNKGVLVEFKFVNETEEQLINGIYQVLCYYVILKLLKQLSQCEELKNDALNQNAYDHKKWAVDKIVMINLQTGTYWFKDVKKEAFDQEWIECEKAVLISIFDQNISAKRVIEDYRKISSIVEQQTIDWWTINEG